MNWLFLKGLARSQAHWDRQPAVFADLVPGARVHLLDLPGIGEAQHLRAPWKMAELAADLRERFLELKSRVDAKHGDAKVADAEQAHAKKANPGKASPKEAGTGEAEPWGIMGISLGGMIAMEWISRYPGDFERAVIITSSAANLSPPWKRLLPSVGPNYVRAVFAKSVIERERRSLAVTTNDTERREELVASYIEIAKTCAMPMKAVNRQLLAATRWRAPSHLPIPTLFLGSFADHMVHPSCTPALAAHFAAPLHMHETSGHEIPHDDPFWIAERVADWLERK